MQCLRSRALLTVMTANVVHAQQYEPSCSTNETGPSLYVVCQNPLSIYSSILGHIIFSSCPQTEIIPRVGLNAKANLHKEIANHWPLPEYNVS